VSTRTWFRIGYWRVLVHDAHPGVFAFHSGLMIDADGHPEAYHPTPGKGLDLLANAGRRGNWWGLSCDPYGEPYVQVEGDPAPGYYVSTTALEDPAHPPRSPRRFVHSGEVPFIVLPSAPRLGAHLGDLCMVLNAGNGESSAAIYGDVGPSFHLGEGSMALAKNLGVNPSPIHGGVGHGIVTFVFKGTAGEYPASLQGMAEAANGHFRAIGGYAAAKGWFPLMPWEKGSQET
jgi:hypothetical protein